MDNNSWQNYISPIILAILVFIPNIITSIAQFRKEKKSKEDINSQVKTTFKVEAEASDIIVQTSLALVTPLKERIKEMECELNKAMDELKNLYSLLNDKELKLTELEKREEEFLAIIDNLRNEIAYLTKELTECRKRLQGNKNTPS